MLRSLRAIIVVALCASGTWALMPPHVSGTNLKDGVLEGANLILRGHTFSASDPKAELTLVDAATRAPARWTHEMSCAWVGDCESGRPGSCQEACTLTVTLLGVADGARLEVAFLDLKQTFRVLLPKASPCRQRARTTSATVSIPGSDQRCL